jgi:hypothetical protein
MAGDEPFAHLCATLQTRRNDIITLEHRHHGQTCCSCRWMALKGLAIRKGARSAFESVDHTLLYEHSGERLVSTIQTLAHSLDIRYYS